MKLHFLFKIITVVKEKGVAISPDFFIKDMNHAIYLIKQIEDCLVSCSMLTDKAFINNPKINIPIVNTFLEHLGFSKHKNSELSVLTNTLYYNLLLLLMYKILIMIEQWLDDNSEAFNVNVKADLKNIKNNVMVMIHPSISKKIKNRGVSILLNTIAGYDSEYELDSSIKMTNKLISIQIANCTSIYIKVPLIDTASTKSIFIEVDNDRLKKAVFGENQMKLFCFNSMDTVIEELRDLLYRENDNLIKTLTNELNNMEHIKSFRMTDYILFTYPKTDVATFIRYLSEYTSTELVRDTENLQNEEHNKALLSFFKLLNKLTDNDGLSSKMLESIQKSSNKPSSRISYRFGDYSRLSVTINRVLYLCMHESAADLSILKDFDEFKQELDIVGRSYVTRGKPLILDNSKSKLYLRDTILISPAGAKSLASVGNIYGDEYRKLDIGEYRQGNMLQLLKENKTLFEEYAIRDSLITLKHACSMEEFYLEVDKIGVPLTISGIGNAYVLKEWTKSKYKGYQVHKDITIGNLASKVTPKDARSTELARHIVSYIAAYRGGRNEAMMYGIDSNQQWIDYDLTSAYTTVMSLLGHPDTAKAARVFNKTVEKMSKESLLFNYMTLDVEFRFKKGTKYPSIPTRVDDNVDIYPLEGRSVITGAEYWVAKSMGCHLYVRDGILIPFKSVKTKASSLEGILNSYETPFRDIMKGLQSKRREYPKKTFFNYMYKEIGNSIYGLVSMGISGRKGFDLKTKANVRLEGGILSNPILASYITGFTRALVSECMNNVSEIGGNVVSVTTDGFLTNVKDLENKLLEQGNDKTMCLNLYRELRKSLTTFKDVEGNAPEALEIKNIEDQGLISWKTRGNLGFTDGGVSAATGFQAKYFDKEFLVNEFTKLMDDKRYVVEFIQSSLRSGRDIFNKGGHVIAVYKDRKFSIEFDNKRSISETKLDNCGFLDSVPWKNIEEYAKIRILKNTVNNPIYTAGSVRGHTKVYKTSIETSVRGFIKAYLSDIESNRYGLPNGSFNTYNELINFIHGYEQAREVKLTSTSISRLKNRNSMTRTVPRTPENEGFINYVKTNFKNFDSDRFFRELSSAMKIRKDAEKKAEKEALNNNNTTKPV